MTEGEKWATESGKVGGETYLYEQISIQTGSNSGNPGSLIPLILTSKSREARIKEV